MARLWVRARRLSLRLARQACTGHIGAKLLKVRRPFGPTQPGDLHLVAESSPTYSHGDMEDVAALQKSPRPDGAHYDCTAHADIATTPTAMQRRLTQVPALSFMEPSHAFGGDP